MKFKKTVLLFVLLFCIALGTTEAQMSVASEHSETGISAERMGRYANFLESEISEGRIPGAVSLVMRKGEIVHQANLWLQQPNG